MSNEKRSLLQCFVQYQIQRGIIKSEEKELYEYGFLLLWTQAMNIVVLILIGIWFRCLGYLLLFAFLYMPLRSYAGGYHAKTPLCCFVISAGVELLAAWLLTLPIAETKGFLPVTIIGMTAVLIALFAPIEAVQKPLGEKERRKYKRRTYVCLCCGMLLGIWGSFTGEWKVSFVVVICYTIILCFMLPEKMGRPQSDKTIGEVSPDRKQ